MELAMGRRSSSVAMLALRAIVCATLLVSFTDAFQVLSISRPSPSPFADALFNDTALRGPVGGMEVVVEGTRFREESFTATMDKRRIDSQVVDSETARVWIPSSRIAKTALLEISDGTDDNLYSATFTYEYVLGTEFNSSLLAFYSFSGDLKSGLNRSLDDREGRIPSSYGHYGPNYSPDRNGVPDRALMFARGERVEMPAMLGQNSSWTLCMWAYIRSGSNVLFAEQDHSKNHRVNVISILDAGAPEGIIELDGVPVGNITLNTWQFICVSRTDSTIRLYAHGDLIASVPANMDEELMNVVAEKSMLGVGLVGQVDDVWAWNRALKDYEVNGLYHTEEYAVELDGVSGHFEVYSSSSQSVLDSAAWRPNSRITVEAWINPAIITGTHVILDQPVASGLASGVTLSIVNGGKVRFSVVTNSAQTQYRTATTDAVVVEVGTWAKISAVYDTTSITIYVDGVVQLVGGGLNSVKFYTVAPTLSPLPIELSTQPMRLGKSAAGVGDGFVGRLGEVRLWSRALSTADVANMCPLAGTETDLFALIRMDDGMGNNYADGNSQGVYLWFISDLLPFWVRSSYYSTSLSLPHSTVDGPGVTAANSSVPAWFVAQTRGECGKLRKEGGDDLQVVLVGPLDRHMYVVEGEIEDNGDGTYVGEYVHHACGHYALRVEGKEVPFEDQSGLLIRSQSAYFFSGSPYKVYIYPGLTEAAHTFAYDDEDLLDNDDLETAYAGVPASFIVQAVDKWGCARMSGGDSIEAMLEGPYNSPIRASVTDLRDGRYLVTYTPVVPGPHVLSVTLNGTEHIGTNNTFTPREKCGTAFGDDGPGSPWCIQVSAVPAALQLDNTASEAYVEVDHADPLSLSSPPDGFTLEAWVKPLAGVSVATRQNILSKESERSGHGYWFALGYVNDTARNISAGFYIGSDTYRTIESESTIPVDEWTHVAVTYTKKVLRLLVNGDTVKTESWGGASSVRENSQPLTIGWGFNGVIDEVKISPRVKSEEDIMNTMHCPADSSVIAYWAFNEQEGLTVYDASDNAFEGRLVNSPQAQLVANQGASTNAGQLEGPASSVMGPFDPTVGIKSNLNITLVDKCGLPFGLTSETDIAATVSYLDTERRVDIGSTFPNLVATLIQPVDITVSPDHPGCGLVGEISASFTPAACGAATVDVTVGGEYIGSSPISVKVDPGLLTNWEQTTVTGLRDAVTGLESTFVIEARDKSGCLRPDGYDEFVVLVTRTAVDVNGTESDEELTGSDAVSYWATVQPSRSPLHRVSHTPPSPGLYSINIGLRSTNGSVVTPITGSPFTIAVAAPEWRRLETMREGPDARYQASGVVYGEDLFVVRGWGGDKMARGDTWRHTLKSKHAWAYRRMIEVTDYDGDYAVGVTIDTVPLVSGGKMRTDCADVRFQNPSTGAHIPHWVSPSGLPGGCSSPSTTFYLRAPHSIDTSTVVVEMLYGNEGVKTPLADASTLFEFYESFDGSLASRWGPATQVCELVENNVTAFAVDKSFRGEGKGSLMVDNINHPAGALASIDFTPLSSYIIRGHFYDSNAQSASHWISPDYNCDLGGSYVDFLAVGLQTASSATHYSTFKPALASNAERAPGWHAFEIRTDEVSEIYVDDVRVRTTPHVGVTQRVHIRGGDSWTRSVAWWDAVFVTKFSNDTVVSVGEEEAVISAQHMAWSNTATHHLQPPTRHASAAVLNGSNVYLLGGFDAPADHQVWALDLESKYWSQPQVWGSLRPAVRRDHAVALDTNTSVAYVLFGRTADGQGFDDVWAFHINDGYWSRVDIATTSPPPRFGHAAHVYNNRVYVFGGYVFGVAPTDEVWVLDLATYAWTVMESSGPSPHYFASTALDANTGSVYVHGGLGEDSMPMADLWKYQLETNTWTEVAQSAISPGLLDSATMVVYGQKLFIFGGHGNNTYSQDLWSVSIY